MKPLEGMTVLDFTQFTSGPVCTFILADYGAQVYKLENPPYGDQNHYNTPSKNKHTMYITSLNHNKKSMLLNMKDPEHNALFRKMVETADLVIDNFKAGTLEKFGITYEVLSEINPKVVWTSLAGYGQTGPWAKRAAYDMTIQAVSGMVSVSGDEGSAGVKAGVSMSDFTSGLQSCCGTLAALIDAKRTGKGRRLDFAMLDSSFSLLEQPVAEYLATQAVARPFAREHRHFVPYNGYALKDGTDILICTRTDEQYARLCDALGISVKPEHKTVKGRLSDRAGVDQLVGSAVVGLTYEEVAEVLEKADIPYGRINRVDEVVASEQCRERAMIRPGKYRDGTEVKIVGTPIKLSGTEEQKEVSYCFKGEDTIAIAARYIGEEKAHALFDEVVRKSDEAWAARTENMK